MVIQTEALSLNRSKIRLEEDSTPSKTTFSGELTDLNMGNRILYPSEASSGGEVVVWGFVQVVSQWEGCGHGLEF